MTDATRDALLKLAREATNGWACHAKRNIEHAEIARIHAMSLARVFCDESTRAQLRDRLAWVTKA